MAYISSKTQNTKHQIPQGGNEFSLLQIHQIVNLKKIFDKSFKMYYE